MENSYTNMVELIKDYNSANVGNYLNQSITLGTTTLICDIYRVADNSNLTSSVFTGCTAVDANTQIIVGKNLSVASGVTLRPPYRCKGIFVGCEGTFTNSGTISMTARGASGTGQDIPLFKTYKIDATGGSGGARSYSDSDSTSAAVVTNGKVGSSPASGVLSCGGGGSGGAVAAYSYSTSGAGGSGTSFSGGAGGGGAGIAGQNSTGKVSSTGSAGSSTGGAGGKSATLQYNSLSPSLGGAGNPKGSSYYTSGTPDSNGDGTGGLLVIIAKHLVSSGNLYSEGSQGPGGTSFTNGAGGGASGGGCIVLLSKDSNVTGTTSVAGGSQSSMSGTNVAKGGKGGDGVLADINESNLVLSDGEDLSLGITESQYLSQIPVQNGRLLGLSDKNGLYYEYDGTRYKASDVSSLGDLDNVNISSAADKQVLTYDSTTSKWKNANATGGHTIENSSGTSQTQRTGMQFNAPFTVTDDSSNDKTIIGIDNAGNAELAEFEPPSQMSPGISNLANLDDTDITNPTQAQLLSYDTVTSKWKNEDVRLQNLANVSIFSASDGQALVYDSSASQWKNKNVVKHVYSTTEQEIGTWIDGKTIYEKTIVCNAPSVTTPGTDSQTHFSIGASVDSIIDLKARIIHTNFTIMNIYTNTSLISSSSVGRLQVVARTNLATSNANNISIMSDLSGTFSSSSTIYVTVQYTKV